MIIISGYSLYWTINIYELTQVVSLKILKLIDEHKFIFVKIVFLLFFLAINLLLSAVNKSCNGSK